jgi:alpha-mannosidase
MDNFEIGLHFLKDTFGITPHVAWSIDTFGFSAYTPALLNKYGIDTVYLSRIGNINKGYAK